MQIHLKIMASLIQYDTLHQFKSCLIIWYFKSKLAYHLNERIWLSADICIHNKQCQYQRENSCNLY